MTLLRGPRRATGQTPGCQRFRPWGLAENPHLDDHERRVRGLQERQPLRREHSLDRKRSFERDVKEEHGRSFERIQV